MPLFSPPPCPYCDRCFSHFEQAKTHQCDPDLPWPKIARPRRASSTILVYSDIFGNLNVNATTQEPQKSTVTNADDTVDWVANVLLDMHYQTQSRILDPVTETLRLHVLGLPLPPLVQPYRQIAHDGKKLQINPKSSEWIHRDAKVIIKSIAIKNQLMEWDKIRKEFETLISVGPHPQIVKLLGVEFCSSQDGLWTMMVALPHYAGDLQQIVSRPRSQKDEDQSIWYHRFDKWAAQLHEVLGLLRSRGVLHNQVRPENICYTYNYKQIVLIDFSRVELQLDPQVAAQLSATSFDEYSAPEQTKNKKFHLGSDLWSAGIVMWELYVGFTRDRNGNKTASFGGIMTAEQIGEKLNIVQKALGSHFSMQWLEACLTPEPTNRLVLEAEVASRWRKL